MKKYWHPSLLVILVVSLLLSACSTIEDIKLKIPALAPTEEVAVPVNPEWDSAVSEALQDSISTREDPVYKIYKIDIVRVEYSPSGKNAVLWLGLVDPETDMMIPTEAGMAIAIRNKGEGLNAEDWKISLQTDGDWDKAIKSMPDDLISKEVKSQYVSKVQKIAKGEPLRGYKLPYPAGRKMYLTGSIGHVLTYKSCPLTCLYAFDFGDGTNFPVLASKAGVVKMAVWKYPNDYHKYANFIILEDTSTKPTTYQVYYHMAYDSIPAALRTPGARVEQGQLIGYADNTGASTGSHLHFMVHTNPTSFWGTSVDVVFDEVKVNGGRPRKCKEAQLFPGYGSQCEPKDIYISQNTGDKTPPTGTITAPAAFASINNRYLTVTGTASDNKAVAAFQLYITSDGSKWQPASTVLAKSPFSTSVDLCSMKLPVGPFMLGLQVMDTSGNLSSTLQGMRSLNMAYDCSKQPTATVLPAKPTVAPTKAPTKPPAPAVPTAAGPTAVPTKVPPTAVPTKVPATAVPTKVPATAVPTTAPVTCTPSDLQVAIYQKANYQGTCTVLNISNIRALTAIHPNGFPIESVKLGSQAVIAAYAQPNLTGERFSFLESIPSVSAKTGKLNWVQSLRIVKRSALPNEPILIQPATLLGGAPNANDEINLTWKIAPGAEDYASKIAGPNGYSKILNWQSGFAWNLGPLPAGTYTWTVIARNVMGTSMKTETFVIMDPSQLPKTIMNKLPGETQSNVIQLKWDAKPGSTKIKSFEIEINQDNAGWITWKQSIPANQKLAYFVGEPGSSYQFRIRAIDLEGSAEEFQNLNTAPVTIAATCEPDVYDNSAQPDDKTNPTLLENDSSQTHNFCKANDQDWYLIETDANNTYRLQITPEKGNVAAVIEILDPATNEVLVVKKADDLNQVTQLDWKSTNGGTFLVQVKPLDPQITGTDAL